jgi:hypothetical protein
MPVNFAECAGRPLGRGRRSRTSCDPSPSYSITKRRLECEFVRRPGSIALRENEVAVAGSESRTLDFPSLVDISRDRKVVSALAMLPGMRDRSPFSATSGASKERNGEVRLTQQGRARARRLSPGLIRKPGQAHGGAPGTSLARFVLAMPGGRDGLVWRLSRSRR